MNVFEAIVAAYVVVLIVLLTVGWVISLIDEWITKGQGW